MNKADEIRKFVAANFASVGTFQTKDVMNLGESNGARWTSSHVGAALHTWVTKDWLVDGYRIERSGEGRATTYRLVDAKAASDAPAGAIFTGEILEETNGNFLVRREGYLYKATRFKW